MQHVHVAYLQTHLASRQEQRVTIITTTIIEEIIVIMTMSHLAELHDDVLGGVGAEDELEILDGGQLHAAPEVEAPATQPLIPMRRLVAQLHALPPIPLLHIHALELR